MSYRALKSKFPKKKGQTNKFELNVQLCTNVEMLEKYKQKFAFELLLQEALTCAG